jgi:DNA polymerase III delta subunit
MAGPAGGELREGTLLPGYFFFGEEDYLAEEFVDRLERALAGSSGGEFHLTRLDLDEAKWRDVVDAGRTAPFLFEPWRALVVRVPERQASPGRTAAKGRGEGEEGRGTRYLSALDQKILREYFADPPARTVMVVIRAGRVRRDDPIVRYFQSLPKTAVQVTEMKRLTEYRLMQRADEKARSLGKTLSEAARKRLFNLLGPDLRLMMNEISKLADFVGDKKGIDEADVSQATASQRDFQDYELDDALAAADFGRCAAILRDRLEDERPEQVLGRLAGFFRSLLDAQTWLREKSRTKDEIFQAFFAHISKTFGDLYRRKYDEFFGAVEGLTPAELRAILQKLRRLDRALKTTGAKDAGEKVLFEAFLGEYCLARRKRTIISTE